MNIVTANKNKAIIDKLEIDIIKRVDGEYEIRDLLSKFVNLYFNKIILDITSIKNYEDVNTMIDLSKAIDPNRIIILLDETPAVNSKLYLSTLVKNGIYNFTRNYEGITYLYEHPAKLEDVQYLLLSEEEEDKEKVAIEQAQSAQEGNSNNSMPTKDKMIIGISNLTNHAGASTLTNMMVRQLNNHGYDAIGLEMFKQDLMFYHDDEHYISILSKLELESKLKLYENKNCIVIDLNDFTESDKYCDVTLYLVEPSYIMLTKLLRKNRNAFLDHKDDIIVLNKSFVNEQEIPDFEYETKSKIFFNLPPLNDRNADLDEINALLNKLGFRM